MIMTTEPKTLSRILTVDDDDDVRMVASMVLRKKGGFEVFDFSSGFDAIDHLNDLADADYPDLIMLDVMMPGIDGPQTLALIRQANNQAFAHIPIIFITAKCQQEEVERLIGLGAAGVIAKPFDVAGLAGQVQSIWDDLQP